jgi:hypothetical protein
MKSQVTIAERRSGRPRGAATAQAAPQVARVHAKCRMMHQMQFRAFAARSGTCAAAHGRQRAQARHGGGRRPGSRPGPRLTGAAAVPSGPRTAGRWPLPRDAHRAGNRPVPAGTGRQRGTTRWWPPLPSAMNRRRSPTRTPAIRRPRTSQRRSPARTIASTIALSRSVRSAPSSRSTSPGARIFSSVRGTRTAAPSATASARPAAGSKGPAA